MPRIEWSKPGNRVYESGVDRGVLYVGSNPGVAWPGLRSVVESPSGGSAKPYYLDGVKYLNLSTQEEFEATISAFSAPKEFNPCDGIMAHHKGLFVTNQTRKSFGLSYRTFVGNDTSGQEYAYKIHLVYNALAEAPQRGYSTRGESVDPTDLAWKITTLPPIVPGFRRSAHLIVDSRYTEPALMGEFLDILYGSELNQPSLPDPAALTALFT